MIVARPTHCGNDNGEVGGNWERSRWESVGPKSHHLRSDVSLGGLETLRNRQKNEFSFGQVKFESQWDSWVEFCGT